MRTGRIRKWVVAAVSASAVGAPPATVAQPPAARLQPIDPDRAPTPPVARSAYPDIPDANVQQVPAQKYAGQPQPPSRSWIGGAWSGVKEFADSLTSSRQPAPQVVPPPAPPASRQPTPRQAQPPVPQVQMPAPAPQPRLPEQALPPQPGVYAGPPAYRWYGWGSTTPGTNQYAPHGLYPKGSAAWHAHTGATPGAFPVPVQYPSATPGVEPPVYAGNPQNYDASYVAPARATRPDPLPTYDPRGTGESVARAPVGRPTIEPPPGFPPSPTVPGGVPVSVDARPPEVNWQTVKPTPGALPTVPPKSVSPQSPTDPQWVPVSGPGTYPGTTVPNGTGGTRPTSGMTLVRGQEPVAAKPTDINALIRETCFSRVSQVRIAEAGPRKLTITFVTSTEQLAREAAALVSELPELRPYEVRFEVQLAK